MPTALCRAELLTIEGRDAIAFAQAQFTSDVAALEPARWQWSAWLDAQGRARAVFALLRVEAQRLLAWQPLGEASALRDALRRYVFRSAVRLETVDGWALHRLDTPSPGAGEVAAIDGGHAIALPGTAERTAWLAPAAGTADAAALASWRREDLVARLPLLAGELAGEFVPQALELERIGAIRFDKGCYPGQEIAARLHFRGGNKRHLQVYRVDGKAPVPAPGTGVLVDGAAVGRILYVTASPDEAGGSALAVVQDDSRTSAAVTIEGHALSPRI
ncbi:MAG: CAF17-like 4Fe-4S cluster assembly/insertion protein YgfZ [Dokdonella sp.]|uniref:CAF17-like 4Fe-4S cluster assembly/insertion protein YgfZ n=1 Tax=Dokdonella sp. TaxID=2291710 RepID=UPI003F81FAB4